MRSLLLFICLRRGFLRSYQPASGFMLSAWGSLAWESDMTLRELFLLATSN
jgi:hypothetical protein